MQDGFVCGFIYRHTNIYISSKRIRYTLFLRFLAYLVFYLYSYIKL